MKFKKLVKSSESELWTLNFQDRLKDLLDMSSFMYERITKDADIFCKSVDYFSNENGLELLKNTRRNYNLLCNIVANVDELKTFIDASTKKVEPWPKQER